MYLWLTQSKTLVRQKKYQIKESVAEIVDKLLKPIHERGESLKHTVLKDLTQARKQYDDNWQY